MENILNFTRESLAVWLDAKGIRPFRANQIFKWIYLRQANGFDQMTDLSKALRQTLNDHFDLPRLVLESRLISSDGTQKFLYRLADGHDIESVLIPEKDHFTVCISSQVGCAQGCRFCLTAKDGLVRNLTMAEIVAQVRDARYDLAQKGIDPLQLSNIVFMGMGEPLANYRNVIEALKILTDTDFGLKFATRRITVSTCGLVPKITRLGQDTDVNLAISLNATTDTVRNQLMPVNRTYPLAELLTACRTFSMKPRNKITFEYILIKGVNDTLADAQRLVKLLEPIKAKVNLIPFNPHPGSQFDRPSKARMDAFLTHLLDCNMTAITRKSKGADILAACGQLRSTRNA